MKNNTIEQLETKEHRHIRQRGRAGRMTGALLSAALLLVGCGESSSQSQELQTASTSAPATEVVPELPTSTTEVAPQYQVEAEASAKQYGERISDLVDRLEGVSPSILDEAGLGVDATVVDGYVTLTVVCRDYRCGDGGENRELTVSGTEAGSEVVYDRVSVRAYNNDGIYEEQASVFLGNESEGTTGFIAIGSTDDAQSVMFVGDYPEAEQDAVAAEQLAWMDEIISVVSDYSDQQTGL